MKRSSDNRGPAGMPSFLDESSPAPMVGLDSQDQDANLDTPDQLDTEIGEPAEFDDPAAEQELDLDGEDPVEPVTTASSRGTGRAAMRNRTAKPAPPSGNGLGVIGLVVTLAAAVATQVPAAIEFLSQRHLDPQLLVVAGLLLWTIGRSQLANAALQRRLGELEQGRHDADDELRDVLAQLQERSPVPAQALEAGALEQVMLSLQRQDQKINNLTKAIKMYGKPLMDIASQGTDIAGGVAQLRVMVESGTEATRAGMQRLEDQVRRGSKQLDLGELPEQVRQLGVSLAAVTQRLEDSEVRKSLVRLEDFAKELRQEVQVLQRGEPTQAAAETLLSRLEEARKGLAAGIQQLRDGNLSGLENSIRELMREVSGLATSTAQIQAAVKSGARVAPTASAATPPVAPTTTSTPVAGHATPAAAPAAGDGATGYQTGTRTSGGKNVLGAIARLKQMKG